MYFNLRFSGVFPIALWLRLFLGSQVSVRTKCVCWIIVWGLAPRGKKREWEGKRRKGGRDGK